MCAAWTVSNSSYLRCLCGRSTAWIIDHGLLQWKQHTPELVNTRTASRTQGQYYLHQTGLRVKARVKYSGLLLIMEVPDLKSGLQWLHFRNNLTRILHASSSSSSSSSTVDQLAPKVTTECNNSNKELCITLDNMKKSTKKTRRISKKLCLCNIFINWNGGIYSQLFSFFLLFLKKYFIS